MNILKTLLSLAVKIGKWLLHHLREQGLDLALGYINGKIHDFIRRLAKARTDRRKRWLRGRIQRWGAVLRVLSGAKAKAVADNIEAAIIQATTRRIPMVAEAEREAA